MIKVKLREAMENFRRESGVRLTYDSLAEITGISINTLQALATRAGYNTRLTTIESLCRALNCQPGDLLELVSDEIRGNDEN